MPADPKPEPRVKDVDAMRVARLAGGECVACGGPPGSVHHVLPKGERGDDVAANLVLLCGHGTAGCHGAEHGNPYLYRVVHRHGRDEFGRRERELPEDFERRDAEWVHRRIGEHLMAHRPDTITYLYEKLGDRAFAWLERRYYVKVLGVSLPVLLPATSTPASPSA